MVEVIENLGLETYGIAGIFILYLIYDRQVLLKKLVDAYNKNLEATNKLITLMKMKGKY